MSKGYYTKEKEQDQVAAELSGTMIAAKEVNHHPMATQQEQDRRRNRTAHTIGDIGRSPVPIRTVAGLGSLSEQCRDAEQERAVRLHQRNEDVRADALTAYQDRGEMRMEWGDHASLWSMHRSLEDEEGGTASGGLGDPG